MAGKLVYVYCGAKAGRIIETDDAHIASVLAEYSGHAVDITGADWDKLPVAHTDCNKVDTSKLPNGGSTGQPSLKSFDVAFTGTAIVGGHGRATASNPNPAGYSLAAMQWSSDHADVVRVNASTGILDFLKEGSATITGTLAGITNTVDIQVAAAGTGEVTDFDIATESTPLYKGNQPHFTIDTSTVQPVGADITGVTWSSTNTQVATINASTGVAEYVGEGDTIIKAVKGAAHAQVSIHVKDLHFEIAPFSATVHAGETHQMAIAAGAVPAEVTADSVTWATGSNDVATINSSGLLTAKTSGAVIVKATWGGVTVEKRFVIQAALPAELQSFDIELQGSRMEGDTGTAVVVPHPADAHPTRPRWMSLNTNVMDVNNTTGAVTFEGAGRGGLKVTVSNTNLDSAARSLTKKFDIFHGMNPSGDESNFPIETSHGADGIVEFNIAAGTGANQNLLGFKNYVDDFADFSGGNKVFGTDSFAIVGFYLDKTANTIVLQIVNVVNPTYLDGGTFPTFAVMDNSNTMLQYANLKSSGGRTVLDADPNNLGYETSPILQFVWDASAGAGKAVADFMKAHPDTGISIRADGNFPMSNLQEHS